MEECDDSLCLCIQDSGIGISEEDISNIFDEFTQAKNKNKNHEKGSGLGLAISQKLAHLFHADISLESKGLGHGTKATIKFTIRHQFADYNADRLEPGLSNFLVQMRGY